MSLNIRNYLEGYWPGTFHLFLLRYLNTFFGKKEDKIVFLNYKFCTKIWILYPTWLVWSVCSRLIQKKSQHLISMWILLVLSIPDRLLRASKKSEVKIEISWSFKLHSKFLIHACYNFHHIRQFESCQSVAHLSWLKSMSNMIKLVHIPFDIWPPLLKELTDHLGLY